MSLLFFKNWDKLDALLLGLIVFEITGGINFMLNCDWMCQL